MKKRLRKKISRRNRGYKYSPPWRKRVVLRRLKVAEVAARWSTILVQMGEVDGLDSFLTKPSLPGTKYDDKVVYGYYDPYRGYCIGD